MNVNLIRAIETAKAKEGVFTQSLASMMAAKTEYNASLIVLAEEVNAEIDRLNPVTPDPSQPPA